MYICIFNFLAVKLGAGHYSVKSLPRHNCTPENCIAGDMPWAGRFNPFLCWYGEKGIGRLQVYPVAFKQAYTVTWIIKWKGDSATAVAVAALSA